MIDTERTWTIEIDHLGRPTTVNDSRRMHPFQRAKVDKLWRHAGFVKARVAWMPALALIRLEATPLHRDRRSPQDVAAMAPAVKAVGDGLVDAGVIDDDDATHLASILFHQPDVCGRDGLRLLIVELGAPA